MMLPGAEQSTASDEIEEKRRLFLAVLALIVLTVIPYWNSIQNPFIWIDNVEILEGQLIVDSWPGLRNIIFQNDGNFAGYHRPIYNMVHSLDWWLWGSNPVGFHISSLIFHIANVILLFSIARLLSGRASLAFAASVLWALLPVNSAVVSLIHSKADLLVTFFLLSSFYALLCREKETSKRFRASLLAVSCVCYLFALLSKESAFIFPFIVIPFFWLRQKSEPSILSIKEQLIPHAFLLFICFSVFLRRMSIRSVQELEGAWTFLDRVLTFIPVYSKYIVFSIPGFELTTNDSVTIWSRDPSFYAYALLTVILLFVQIYIFKKYRSSRLSILWFNAFLLPVAQLFPTLHFRADRFLYLPSLGFICLVVFMASEFCRRVQHKPILIRAFSLAFIALSLFFGFRVADRNHDFESNLALFEPLVEKYPECREAQSFLGAEYLAMKNYAKAKIAFESAMSAEATVASYVDARTVLTNYGAFLFATKEYDAARNMFSKLMLKNDRDPQMIFNLAATSLKLKRHQESKNLFNRYLKIEPGNADALFLLGKAEMGLSNLANARGVFMRYLDLHPDAGDRVLVSALVQKIEKDMKREE